MRSSEQRLIVCRALLAGVFGMLVMVSPARAEEAPGTAPSAAEREAEYQALRQKMIRECLDNRGVDCETEVDTELEAQQMDGIRRVIVPQRPRPIVPRPRTGPSR